MLSSFFLAIATSEFPELLTFKVEREQFFITIMHTCSAHVVFMLHLC